MIRQVPRHPLLRWALAGLVIGALGYAILGATPAGQREVVATPHDFTLPPPVDASTTAAAVAGLLLWASQPAVPAGPVGPAVEPPPRLVGIVARAGAEREAVFEHPDGRRLRASTGDSVPGLGLVTAVTATAVRWRDADGALLESRLFLDAQARPVPQAPTDTP